MPPAAKKSPGKLRRWLRRLRLTVLLLTLAILSALLFFHLSGLPDFLRRPLLQKLRDRGLDLGMSTLRWHFYRGIVAENVTFGSSGETNSPRGAAREIELNLNYAALFGFNLEITGVVLNEGKLIVPVTDARQPGRELAAEKIRANLRFLPDDAWALDDFHAQFAGANFSLNGIITNASALRDWPLFHREKPEAPGHVANRLREFADTLEKIHFARAPELRVVLGGDGRDPQSFDVRLTLNTPTAATPWGSVTNGVFTARVFPATATAGSRAELNLHATDAQTPWADVSDLVLTVHLAGAQAGTNVVNADLSVRASRVATEWASVTNASGSAQWIHSLTNAIPLSGSGEFSAAAATTRWAGAKSVSFTATLNTLTNAPAADDSWGAWEKIRPFALGWTLRASQLDAEKIGAEEVVCSGNWNAPLLAVTNLLVRFPEGHLDARARLDIATREASFDLNSDFDAHKISPLLPPVNARWLAKYAWGPPPHFTARGAATLPSWTNAAPDWRGEVGPTVRFAAFLTATNCAYLGAPADWMHTHITYTNLVWRLPDLVAGRPEGTLELVHESDDRTHKYFFGVHSTISPEAVRPLLSTNALRGLDYFKLTQPPVVDGGVWGTWREGASTGFTGRVALANFSFREQTMDRVESFLRYTNLVLEILDPRLTRGTQSVTAGGITADFNARRIFFTNGLSSAEPIVIARAIGPKTGRALEPYVFKLPPVVRVSGYVGLDNANDADLHFDVDGGPFEWWKFRIPHIAGRVNWRGATLELTNLEMFAYDGAAAGFAVFNFDVPSGTELQFTFAATNIDLHLLMPDLTTGTNTLEGRLSGLLVVTNANSENKFSWSGNGDAKLENGLIWALPVFGILSKPLDGIRPGLGSSRFSEGTATFLITNGVMYSKTLEMRALTIRLHYDGTVDFDGRVDTRVEAQLFRDTWVIGPLLSVVTWPMSKLFDYHVTGTLAEPKADAVYMKPFLHPFQTFEDFFSGAGTKTNPPPEKPAP